MTNVNVDRLRPLMGKVILRPDPVEETTRGGIIIPQTVYDASGKRLGEKGKRALWATVVAVGDDSVDPRGRRWPTDIVPGDRVAYNEFATQNERFKDDDGKPLLCVSQFAVVLVDDDSEVRMRLRQETL